MASPVRKALRVFPTDTRRVEEAEKLAFSRVGEKHKENSKFSILSSRQCPRQEIKKEEKQMRNAQNNTKGRWPRFRGLFLYDGSELKFLRI